FSALDYLLKPIDKDELVAATKRVKERWQLPLPEQLEMLLKQVDGKVHHFTRIAIPTSEGFEMLPADQVVRCEAHDNYTYLFLKDRSKLVACRTLKDMEEQFQHFKVFLRVHHSHFVNLNEVIKYVR